MSDTVLLTAPRWWDGHRARTGARVLVADGRIADTDCRLPPPGATRLDLPGHTLLPGLIDCHVHLAQTPEAPAPPTTAGQALAALPVLRALLANGFTTVRDLGSTLRDPPTVHLRHALRAGTVPGPRLLVAPHIISARAGHGDHSPHAAAPGDAESGAVADGAGEVLRRVRLEARLQADWIKCAATGGLTSSTDGPGRPTYTQDELDTLVAAAADLGLPCAAHAFSDEGITRAVRAGVRSIEHACLATPPVLDLIADRGVFLVPTLHAVGFFLDRLDDDGYWAGRGEERAKLARHADTLRGHGARVAACRAELAYGTDAGMFPHAQNWREFPAMTTAGLTPEQALRSATATAGALLRRPGLGTLAVGAEADLVAVPGDPLRDIDAMSAVDFVMQGGAVRHAPP
ncbi:metal-dependent hydrolase family protein [Streptomyces subrutilus]|uniref:Amidohydrolase family protein n=1 Tax=Streptomyces subrutilus TaxID=36818 RepID=A0A5P2UI55_9ACTN|nr:amidohydrolase family protein [Streptomyces subrutilus]QEU77461.1 amidohydrolase family protein [Streptomyces subrutilus]WSJ33456.1 amidohydrolase family protein [Streptomyces subrutilus]GGZ47640.1 Xaa-Pro dipeptidase [Streptomyces subrutilus]